ncbi:MAG: rod shape-determining protein, partial [Patescibacteria group bacterium]|nr:rod shape-determining protein [Patescibacteria group bacterium]
GEAYLIEEPMAGAIGEGVSVFQPTGAMIVDIGGGTTEIAVISLGGIVVSRSLKIAGDEMDQAIVHYIRLRHGLLLGESQAEDLKIKIGSAYKKNSSRFNRDKSPNSKVEDGKENQAEKMAIIRGRDIETGLPKSIRITEVEVREALAPVLSKIIEEIANTLEEAPPELTSDILEHGIVLTGGGAMLSGLDRLILERTHMPIIVSDDPLTSVARGIGKVLEDDSLLQRVKVTGGLK